MEVMHVVLHQIVVFHESIVQHDQVCVAYVNRENNQQMTNVAVKKYLMCGIRVQLGNTYRRIVHHVVNVQREIIVHDENGK